MRSLSVGFGVFLFTLCMGATSLFAGSGFPNVPQTPGTLLSGLNAPNQGRTAIIAYHNGLLFTIPEAPGSLDGSDLQVRSWDISDPTDPEVVSLYGVTPQPVNAHGYMKSGDYLIIGSNWPPEAPWSFRATTPGAFERTTFPGLVQGLGVRGMLFFPWFVGDTYWSYGEVSGNAFIQRNTVELSNWDHLGQTGVIGHPFLIGNLLIFASDQSRTGVATYDVSDPSNPVLLDVLTTGGPGGYWPEVWGGDGKLYVVFPYRTAGNGIRVVDVTDPTDLEFITDKPLPGDEAMYMQFQDEYAFVGDHKVDMRNFESVLFLDSANAARPNDGGVGVSTSQFALPIGNLLVTGGVSENQGMAIWAHQAEPDTRGPSVGFHIPRAGQANYPLEAPVSVLIHETLETPTMVNGSTFIVRPLGGSPIAGTLVYSFDDIITFTPDAPLSADTTYEVLLPADGIRDAVGNGMVEYSFTFSTGSSVGGNLPPEVQTFVASAYPVAPAATLTLSATATDPDGDAVEYRFDFGDGSPKTAWSSTPSTQHAYAGRGHYQATVQVRDTLGSLSSEALTITVLEPPVGPRPNASTSLLCDTPGRRVWTVHPDNDTLAVLDADTLAVVFEVPTCRDPRALGLTQGGEVWVTCHDDDRLGIYAASNGASIAEIAVDYGAAPTGLVVSPDGSTVYVSLQGRGDVRRYNVASRQETGRLSLGDLDEGSTPRAMALSGNGSRLLVGRFLTLADDAEVWEIDTVSWSVQPSRHIPKAGNEDNRDTTASGKGIANYLSSLLFTPDSSSAWVTATKPNTERGLFFGGEDLDSDNSVRNQVIDLDLATGQPYAIDLDNSESASALGYSPLGDYLFVTLQGNDEVVVLDALAIDESTGLGSFVTRLGTGAAPQGVCTDADSGRTFVKNFTGRSVTALGTGDLFVTGNKAVGGTEVATVGSEILDPQVLLGKQIFYRGGDPRMSAEGYLSCATCHLDGGQDGRVWDFTGRGEGFRNTTSLRSRAGMGQGNVHWSANFDEIQDFENDIRGPFGGGGFLDDADFAATSDPLGPPKSGLSPDLDALAAYVASLDRQTLPGSPFRQADGSMTAQGADGEMVFQNLGCADCHQGAEFTDSTLGIETLHDVGTLRTTSGNRLGQALDGIDTPTLRGVWSTAPYLHDGSASILEEVFQVAGGEVIQAETGSVAGGSQVVTQYVDLNYDDNVHQRALVAFGGEGSSWTLSGVDGGSGGVGALELRYSGHGTNVDIIVNGVLQAVFLPNTGNDPAWRHTNWGRFRLEGVSWDPAVSNTIQVVAHGGWPNLSFDDVAISTADDLAQATPHQVVQSASSSDQEALLAFLRQLDGQDGGGNGEPPFFADGFESGSTSAWSGSTP